MNQRLHFHSWLVWSLAFLTLILGGCPGPSPEPPAGVESEPSSALRLPPGTLELAGIETARVESRAMVIPVRATGNITLNPRKWVCLSSRVPGRIEAVYAFEGDQVMAGDTLAALASDEYLATQQEFLQLLARRQRALEAGDAETSADSSKLAQLSAQKLIRLGLSDPEIESLKETRSPNYYFFLRAPLNGSVVVSRARPGVYVERGSELFQVADLRTVWAEVDIFEKDLAVVKPGCKAEVVVPAYPGHSFPGRLIALGDLVSQTTRTIKGRIEVPNGAKKLKPGMFAEVTLRVPSTAPVLSVPLQAIRRVEGRTVVFVSLATDIFEPRPIKVGRIFDDRAEILEGLEEGEVVATEGSFALKAETLKKTLEEEE